MGVVSVPCSAMSGRSARAISLKHLESEDGIASDPGPPGSADAFPVTFAAGSHAGVHVVDVEHGGPGDLGRLVPLPVAGDGAVSTPLLSTAIGSKGV